MTLLNILGSTAFTGWPLFGWPGLSLSSSVSALLAYAANSITPQFVADFKEGVYGKSSELSTFDNVLNHVRNGNATMVDADGLLKWAPHNLLLYSNEFENAAWSKANVTVTANATTAPDGTYTAAQISATSTTDATYIDSPNIQATDGAQYNQKVYVKAGTLNFVAVSARWGGRASTRTWFDLSTGVRTSGTDAEISDEGGGWYLLTLANPATQDGPCRMFVVNGDGEIESSALGYVYAWHAHAHRSDLGGMVNNPATGDSYVPTTDAARYLPRENHHVYNGSAWVKEGYLHEPEAATNLTPYSEDLTNADWEVELLAVTDDNLSWGFSNRGMSKVEINSTDLGRHFVQYRPSLTANTRYTHAVYLKQGSQRYVTLFLYSARFRWVNVVFDLQTGLVTDTQTGSAGVATVYGSGSEFIGDGVYKCWVTFDFSAVDGGDAVGMTFVDSPTPTFDNFGYCEYAGNVGDHFYAWGSQLEAGSVPTSHIHTAGSTVTRAADTLTLPVANIPYPEPVYIGPESVTNGTFNAGTTGWTGILPGFDNISVVANKMRVQSLDGEGLVVYAPLSGLLSSGSVVQVTFDIGATDDVQKDVRLGFYDTVPTANNTRNDTFFNVTYLGNNDNQSYTKIVKLTSDASYFMIQSNGGTGGYFDIDNISVKEINPLAVSFGYKALVTYADTDSNNEAQFVQWGSSGTAFIQQTLVTNSWFTGQIQFSQSALSDANYVGSSQVAYAPGINVPMSFASRHGSTFLNGAVDGTALTVNTTLTAFPDLTTTDLIIAPSGGPQVIQRFIMWGGTTGDIGDTRVAETSATAPEITGLPTIGVS
jgi:hypothetical protein